MFEFDGSASYVLKRQARALTALEGDTDRNRFLVASLELRDANELQVLDFNEDTNEVVCMRAYTHPHETWHMASCPAPEHVELVTTVYSTGTEQRAVRPALATLTTLTALALRTRSKGHAHAASGTHQQRHCALPRTDSLAPGWSRRWLRAIGWHGGTPCAAGRDATDGAAAAGRRDAAGREPRRPLERRAPGAGVRAARGGAERVPALARRCGGDHAH